MRRFFFLVLSSVTLVGCRIEQTPERYIDDQASRTDAVFAARDELSARLALLGPALQRGPAAVDSIFAPRTEITVVGPDRGRVITNSREFVDLLLHVSSGQARTADYVQVTIAPGIAYAWFLADFVSATASDSDPGFRISGVFVRENGVWRLAQAHVSRPATG